MAMNKTMTVEDLEEMLKLLRQGARITPKTKIQLASDAEGNHFGDFVMIDEKYNVGIDDENDVLVLYPID